MAMHPLLQTLTLQHNLKQPPTTQHRSWQSTITMENLILLLHNLIGVDGAGRVDFGSAHHPTPEMDYSEGEARAAFQRVARFHGWKP